MASQTVRKLFIPLLLLSLFLACTLLFFTLLHGQFLLLLSTDFPPLGLFVFHSLQLFLLLGTLLTPLIDVLFQLLVQLTLLGAMLGLGKGLIALLGGLGGGLLLIVLVVRHCVVFVGFQYSPI